MVTNLNQNDIPLNEPKKNGAEDTQHQTKKPYKEPIHRGKKKPKDAASTEMNSRWNWGGNILRMDPKNWT